MLASTANLVIASSVVAAAMPRPARAESSDPSSAREIETLVDGYIMTERERRQVPPGRGRVAWVKDGRLIFSKGYRAASMDLGPPGGALPGAYGLSYGFSLQALHQ